MNAPEIQSTAPQASAKSNDSQQNQPHIDQSPTIGVQEQETPQTSYSQADTIAINPTSTNVQMKPSLDQQSVRPTNHDYTVTLDLQQQQPAFATNQQSSLTEPFPPTSPYQQSQHSLQQTPPKIQPLLADESKSDTKVDMTTSQTKQDPQKSVITKVKLSDELNILDWFRTTDIISQIAEKAKSSVDSVITTLDPGMKEYLYSGGNVNIVVINKSSNLVSPVRDAFQSVFGRATVVAACHKAPGTNIDYPIRTAAGFVEAVAVAQEKIKKFRQDATNVPQNQVVVVVQSALVCIDGTESENKSADIKLPSKWFLTYCMLIEDPVLNVTLECYSQFVPMDVDVLDLARSSTYPDTFHDRHLGFPVSIDELMVSKMKLSPEELADNENGCQWLPKWAGLYETHVIHQLSLNLANAYRRKWNDCATIETVS